MSSPPPQRLPESPRPRYGTAALLVFATANLVITGWIAVRKTRFSDADKVLCQSSWGAGRPDTSNMTAFALLKPWWHPWGPDGIRIRPDGGIEPLVRIEKSKITTSGDKAFPKRSIGYDAMLGAELGLRCILSETLVYDFKRIVRLQRGALIAAWCLLPVALYLAVPKFRSGGFFVVYNICFFLVMLTNPTRNKYLTEGIIDSAMANSLAILSLPALFLIIKNLPMRSAGSLAMLLGAGLFLSFCTMVRGEFLMLFLLYLLFLGVRFLRERRRYGVLVVAGALLAFPVMHGTINKAVLGHFIPLRLQSGQNLYEPIGQYPNPYGIQYSDSWLAGYLAAHNLPYFSPETDTYLTKEYLKILVCNPRLLYGHMKQRLKEFTKDFSWTFNTWTIRINGLSMGLALLCIFLASLRNEDWLCIGTPLLLAIAYLVFFGWTNKLFRLVSPVHFLLNGFLCWLATYLAIRWGAIGRFLDFARRALDQWKRRREPSGVR